MVRMTALETVASSAILNIDIAYSSCMTISVIIGKVRKKMFRKKRRIKQLLSPEDTVAVMDRCTNGVLACLGDEDYPYARNQLNTSTPKDKSGFSQPGQMLDSIISN